MPWAKATTFETVAAKARLWSEGNEGKNFVASRGRPWPPLRRCRFVGFPVAPLASLAAVVRNLTLRASAQWRAPPLFLAEEAAEQAHPQDRMIFGSGFLDLGGLLCLLVADVLVASQKRACGDGNVRTRGVTFNVRLAPYLRACSRVGICLSP